MRERARAGILVVVEQGVECHKYLNTKAMGILDKLRDILKGVACCMSRTKLRRTYIYCVSTRLDGCYAYL